MRPVSGSSAGQGRLHLVNDRLERLWLADCEFGQDLAIDLDAGFGKTVDEARIGEPEFAHRCIEALDPNARKTRFLALRSRVAYCIERSTAALAARIVFLRRP